MRRRPRRGTLLGTVGVLAVTGGLATPSAAEPARAQAGGRRFTPVEVTISAMETVSWTVAEEPHTITSDDGLFDSGTLQPGTTFVAQFHNVGVYRYHCRFHGAPGGGGMSGRVVVEAQSGPPTTAPPTTASPTTAPPTTAPPTTAPPTTAP
ncbi:MAG: hypothetical protein ACRDY7_02995, partial [Acidimicrobiia bacterium]